MARWATRFSVPRQEPVLQQPDHERKPAACLFETGLSKVHEGIIDDVS